MKVSCRKARLVLFLSACMLLTVSMSAPLTLGETTDSSIDDADITQEEQKEAVIQAALKKIALYPELIQEGFTPYEVGNQDANPPEKFDLIDSTSYLALAEQETSKTWNAQ